MYNPTLTIFYQYNPWNATIGGIQSVINTFIKYAPETVNIRLVGTEVKGAAGLLSAESSTHKSQANWSHQTGWRQTGWQKRELMGRPLQFFPLLSVTDDNVRGLIPTTLKYTAALRGLNLSSDFMHFHRIEPAMMTGRWQGEKTLFIHNDVEQQLQGAKQSKSLLWQRFPSAYFLLERFLINQFDQILSCNARSTQYYCNNYPNLAPKVSDVRNAVDSELFRPLPSDQVVYKQREVLQQLQLSPSTRIVFFAGRLHPQKNPLLLVESIAAMANPEVHLLIAGDGELRPQVERAIEAHKLSRRVTLLGALPREEMVTYHQISDVFVLTSLYEGLPIVALEALSCGTPVVTTDCGQTPSVLTDTSGVVVAENTAQQIASALSKVLHHPDRYPVADCLAAASPYSAHQVTHQIYQDMLARWQPKAVSRVAFATAS